MHTANVTLTCLSKLMRVAASHTPSSTTAWSESNVAELPAYDHDPSTEERKAQTFFAARGLRPDHMGARWLLRGASQQASVKVELSMQVALRCCRTTCLFGKGVRHKQGWKDREGALTCRACRGAWASQSNTGCGPVCGSLNSFRGQMGGFAGARAQIRVYFPELGILIDEAEVWWSINMQARVGLSKTEG